MNQNLVSTINSLKDALKNANLQKLQSITAQLIESLPTNTNAPSNSIKHFFKSTKTPSSRSNKLSITTSHETHSKFKVTSSTIQLFVTNEGKACFELIEQSTNLVMQMMDIDDTKYIFRCSICNQHSSTNNKKVFEYIHGISLNKSDLNSSSFLKQLKRGIEKHVNEAALHIQSVEIMHKKHKLTSPLHVKIKAVYFMLQRSEPLIVFEELMVFLQQLIDHFGCADHTFCIVIGDKQQSVAEAARIIKIFQKVMYKQTIYVIQNSFF